MHYAYFKKNISNIKWEFVTRNYKAVSSFILFHGRAVFNTVVYCLLAVMSALIINPLAAYAMSRYKLPSSYKLLLFMLCTMAFPPMVTAIPNFLMLRSLGLLNTFYALVLPAMANGYAIFLLKGFFDSQPQELYESAQIDGASEWILFWQIAMSLSKPILAVIALQAFNMAYANFMFAFVVCQDEKMWTLMVFLYQLQQRSGQAVMYASLIIAAIPTFIIFLFCQNIIMRGIVVPSEK
ncbi:MAG: carbohydrate ABC transporter permease [Victivallaceae bacterium]|nr:carbohydrate ABC transporter permease [Victivallaceae bacterium]